ncbi:MAG TPA: putative LPS assembly protein LptD [Taishania sp.]|nr:putative LPS assembly protein LptD [Taishania sp.]
MCANFDSFGQDTIYVNDESLGGISKYYARDSTYADLKKQQLHLYGKAYVETEGVNLTAGYILVDMNTEEIIATHAFDEEGGMIEKPVMNMGGDEVEAVTLKYNLRTEKAYIEGVKMVQDEMVLYMGRAKRQANEEIHFVEGRFTTCDLEEPHYHFQLSRAVMVPDKRIVTGPMNLYIAGVPTPIGLPFSYIPQQQDRTHGILFPEIIPTSAYGFGLSNLGYYIPINDYVQTSVYGTLYSRGSWGFRNVTEYAKKYTYSGNFDIRYNHFNNGFPFYRKVNSTELRWIHRKDEKSNPKWNFNTNINFNSSNNSKNNLDPQNPNYFNNTLQSDINLNRNFPGKPYRASAKISLSQNSSTKNITLTSPIVNFSTSQFFPLKKISRKEIFQRLGIIYNIEGKNVSTFKDTLLRDKNFAEIGNQYMYGMRQRITLQTTGGLFKNTLKLTPSVNYGTDLNFQQTRKSYDATTNTTLTDTIRQVGLAHSLALDIRATTQVYSYYRFVGKNKPILRHILTPSASFTYKPLITKNITDSIGVNQNPVTYSPFERSAYTSFASGDQALLNFGVNNSFEFKRKSDKDTITGFKKTRVIESFSLRGYYDFLKDSMQLSNIEASIRISPYQFVSLVGSSSFSFYGWDETTGASTKYFATAYNGKLGRAMNNNISTTFTITSKEGRKQIEENRESIGKGWQADYDYFYLHPERILDFRIPWKVNISHVFAMTRNTFKTALNSQDYMITHTVNVDADLNITKRWKVAAVLNYDLKTNKMVNANFILNRDMHCWALSFRWTPIGMNKSFILTIRNTSSIFGSAKMDFKKPPAFL